MPGYIKAALQKLLNTVPAGQEHAPHTWNRPVYGAKTQYIEETYDGPPVSPSDVTHIQKLGGTLLYYSRAVDTPLVMPVNMLASEQTKSTVETADKIIKLLNYCKMHPEAKLHYSASDMILDIHSDASYL
jgi:hypothetical protein